MQTYELQVIGRSIYSNSDDTTLVRTSVGIDQVHVLFDDAEWLGFPVSVTFAQGTDIVTQELVVSRVTGSNEWSAEATALVPYEVIDMVGPIRVTFQGTDASGNHIITAKGSPLSVEEAGDVTLGTVPSDAPTVSQWNQAYANAQQVVNHAQGLVSNLQSQLDEMLESAQATISGDVDGLAQAILGEYAVAATPERLGLVKVGEGLSVLGDGTLRANATNGITFQQSFQLANLAALVSYCFDTEFDNSGYVKDTAKVKVGALPLSSMVDGTSVMVNDDGKIAVAFESADDEEY